MELETVILESNEDMDLGETQQAYNSYPKAKETFQARCAEYRSFVDELKSKNPATIDKQEIEKADTLYEEAKCLQEKCLDMKAILSRKLEALILESKDLEGDLGYHGRDFKDDKRIESGRSVLKESLELRDRGELTDAVEKAYRARECLAEVLVQVKNVWINKHREKADSLSIEHEA